jgi:hypothetical protein
MQQSGWTRLNREQAQEVLSRLSHHRDAVVFSKEATEVSWRSVPFYSNYRIYRLVNYATMPTFSMHFIGNGDDFITIDGTALSLYAANQKDPIKITEDTAIPYLDFFFSNVQGTEGDVFLIKDPNRMPFMSALTAHQQQSILTSFKPLSVTTDAADASCRVSGTLYYGGGLISATIQITHDGKLAFLEQNLLLTGIYFPHSPHTQQWVEAY